MKRTPLRRKTPLKQGILGTTLAKSVINKVSAKHRVIIAREKIRRAELLEQCGGLCMKCGQRPDWRGLELVHVVFKSHMGTPDDTELWCAPCHGSGTIGGHKTEMPPGWAAGKPNNMPA